MRFILIILMATTMLSCKGNMEHRLKGGMVITIKGDTIEFYGGTLTYKCFGERDIRSVVIDESKYKED
nr:MAG: hypothetical protein [Bacteriophage sp.]